MVVVLVVWDGPHQEPRNLSIEKPGQGKRKSKLSVDISFEKFVAGIARVRPDVRADGKSAKPQLDRAAKSKSTRKIRKK